VESTLSINILFHSSPKDTKYRIYSNESYRNSQGGAIAQAVSGWLPTAAALVRARVKSCGICGGQSGTGTDLFRVLLFPLPIFIPPIFPQSPSSIIWSWYNKPVVAAVPRDSVSHN
jgi:hypothetical protein